jgi:hypothetical protein
MKTKALIIILLMILFPMSVQCATPSVSSAYSYDYTQPPEFQPSLNSRFTALSNGVTDILANPAGIMHVNTLEVALGGSTFISNPLKTDENKIYIDDNAMKGIQGSPNSRAYVRFTDDRSATTAESRPITIDEEYSKGGGINYFGVTYRMADWLAFSISRKRPTAISFNYNVSAPVLIDAQGSFRGATFEAGPGNLVRIRDDGKVEVVTSLTTETSAVSAWSNFLDQGTGEVNWANATLDNTLVNHNSIVITAASKAGAFSWGLNIMPESIDLELNNEVNVYSDPGNADLQFYLPKFNFSNTQEAIDWVTYECGNASGYRSMSIETLAGEKIGEAKVAGKYSASFVRMDLGMQWEPTDYFSMGAVYENFNGATMDLKGVQITQYVQHRVNSQSRMPTEEGVSYWDPFYDTPTHEVETENNIRTALDFKPIELPKKLKMGFAFKKPVLFAVDWEQWQNEYSFSTNPGNPAAGRSIKIRDISFLKMGMESQIFFLPAIFRGSVTGLLRPSVEDPDTEKGLDDIYRNFGIIPVDGNVYLGFGVYDGELGFGVGGGGLPLIQALMMDMSAIAKVFYSNVYYKRGDWQLSYLMTMDPVLTGFESDLSNSDPDENEIKLMQTSTLSLGFRF